MAGSNLARNALFSAAVAALLAGCYTMDPYTGDKKVSDTTKGAGIGALAGGAVGALAGGGKGALIGAGAGALAGGAVGNYMDRQEAKLRAQLQGSGVSVTRNGDTINLVMPGNITFGTGSADLNPSFFGVLDSVALVLKEYNKVPTELLVYPGEPHSLRQYNNIRAKLEWDQAWLDRYVMDKVFVNKGKQ